MARPRFRYSPWDGTQSGFELDEFDLLDELADDLLYHGDVNSALRELMQRGLRGPDGEPTGGLRDLLERLREQRQSLLDQYDLGGVYEEIAEELQQVVAEERAELQRQVDQAEASGDDRRQELARDASTTRNMELDMLPPDLAGQVDGLQRYEFTSAEAAQRFEELLERLREQLVQQTFEQMTGAMSQMTPEDVARMKDMLAELNTMLEQRAAGEEPDFDGFMERHGDFFPENPQDLDELLEVMARRMAAMQAMLNSMTPAQRDQLRQLSEQLLEDLDLNWQVQQLGGHLRDLFPEAPWDESYDFRGDEQVGMEQLQGLGQMLGQLDQLEQDLRSAVDPGALQEVDLDRVRDLLGNESAEQLRRLSDAAQRLADAGFVERRDGRLELTARGLRRLGQSALGELFRKLDRDRMGSHELERSGFGHERSFQSKPYEWGDPFQLDLTRTIRNAVLRGETVPLRLQPDDFEIEQTEQVVRSSTVLMLDLSLSMPMRGNFLPAKKVAMALHTLISMQYPRDYLGLVAFSETARILAVEDLPEASWDYVYGTNMQHGFQLARRLLDGQPGTKQILMITDGEPTAHINAWGEPEFHYPPIRETVDATMLEVGRCTRAGITINTFMLDPDPSLQHFVERMTEFNRGRAFFTTPENLGDYVLVDFIEQRRELVRGRR